MMLIGVAVLTFFFVKLQSARYTQYSTASALQMSDVIKRSIEYSMLLNRREDIANTIKTIGTEPGIDGVRIYNKKGETAYTAKDGELGSKIALSSEICTTCHRTGSAEATAPAQGTLTRVYTSPAGERLIGVITPIKNDIRCSSADCHAHDRSQTVLGILNVTLPLKETDKNLAEFETMQYQGGIMLIIIVTVFTGIFLWRMVNIPVQKLTDGTQAVIQGNLDYAIDVQTKDEIGLLTRSFNHMTRELKRAQDDLKLLNATLEKRVQEKTEELQRTQTNIVQMEKMVSLGTLAATVAHELNNPLEGILTYAKLIQRRIQKSAVPEEAKSEICEELKIIADETSRCGSIVKNLLLFSRRRVGELREHNLRDIVQQTAKLIDHHLMIHSVTFRADVAENLPRVLCDGQQISQALLALEINAVEAMPQGGTLSITVRSAAPEQAVTIAVSDTGYGIAPEVMPHIFEPFYTTKKEGKGTGLGLAVVYGIIERHGGTIDVASSPADGTTFTITLPLRPPLTMDEIS
ncbi:MAG: sensor histidine kinase [Acidobacteriota bacterium]